MTNEEANSAEKAPTTEQHLAAALYEIRDILKETGNTLKLMRNDLSAIRQSQR